MRHHVNARSMTTASAMTEHAASGIMTGPPRARMAITALTRHLQRRDSTDGACFLRFLATAARGFSRRRRSRPGRSGPALQGWLALAGEGLRAGWLFRQDQLVRLCDSQPILLAVMHDDHFAAPLEQ